MCDVKKEKCSEECSRAMDNEQAEIVLGFAFGAVLFELQELQAITPLDAQPAALSLATAGENKKKIRAIRLVAGR